MCDFIKCTRGVNESWLLLKSGWGCHSKPQRSGVFVWFAETKSPKPSGFNNRILLSHGSEVKKFKMQGSLTLVLSEGHEGGSNLLVVVVIPPWRVSLCFHLYTFSLCEHLGPGPPLSEFYWSIVDSQTCVSFRCPAKWIRYIGLAKKVHLGFL